MPSSFATYRPPEASRQRKVQVAVEVLDPVRCERIRDGLRVVAHGTDARPIVNASGVYVWTQDGPAPTAIEVLPQGLPFEPRTVPVPALPSRFVSVTLAPTTAYAFPAGLPGVVGRLIVRRLDVPVRPVTGASVWLQWIDDVDGTPVVTDSPIRATTDRNGDFAVIARLRAEHEPVVDSQGRWRVRVVVLRSGTSVPLRSPEFSLTPGRVDKAPTPFAWAEFVP